MFSCESPSTSTGSKSAGKLTNRPSDIKKVSETVWEFYSPRPPGIPKFDVIFFHGLQLFNYKEAFWKTWLSRDEMVVWPKEWLAECFPEARILSISYDSSARKISNQSDLFVIIENMITDLILSECGAGQHSPVILVGHSFGGIVIKRLLLMCDELRNRLHNQYDMDRIKTFLENCKGVFYYSTPHGGSRLADYAALIPGTNKSLVNFVQTLNTERGRINDNFSKLRRRLGITTQSIGESLPTKYKGFEMKIVEEASAKQDIDGLYYTAIEADHFDVCKPRDKTTCSSFQILSLFISTKVLHDTQADPGDQLTFDFPLPKHFVDDDERVQLARERLQLQDPRPLCLAIIGMGGIGKTTVAKALLIKLSPEFDFVCFVKDVKEEIKKKSLSLEELLKGNLYRGQIKVHLNGGQSLWTILKGKKVLLVMDDINSEEQIDEISSRIDQEPSWFGEGSRVIATSRSSQEFPPKFLTLQLKFLSQAESNKLFRRHLHPNIEQEMPKDLVERVVKKCDGLPLTLEVIGKYLRCEKDEMIWNSAIDSLSKAEAMGGASNDMLWAKLKYSFVNLAKREQNMFLDLVAFYDVIRGHNFMIEFLKGAWAGADRGFAPDTGLRNLEERCFIQHTPVVKWDNQRPTLWIHEQLRDMAKNIACPLFRKELWSRVWLYDETHYFLTIYKGRSAMEVLQLDIRDDSKIPKMLKIQWSCLARLEELRFLSINGTKQTEDRIDDLQPGFSIRGSGNRFSSNLALLRLHGCDGGPRHMPFLKRQNWPIRERDLMNLTNLGALEIHNSHPVHLPLGFHKLVNLRVLVLGGNKLKQLPEDFGHLPSLEMLIIRHEPLKVLPESFGHLSTLRHLHIHYCSRLQSLPHSFGHIVGLQEVILEWPVELTELPRNFGNLSHLRALTLKGCCSLEELPDSFWKLSALQTLVIEDCSTNISTLAYVAGSVLYFSKLKVLKLQGCDELRELPSNFWALAHLHTLELQSENLENLSWGFGYLKALQTLSMNCCNSLQSLPDSFGGLWALQTLSMFRCKSFNSLPNSFGRLKGLQHLSISFCESLHTLPHSFGHLSMLENLTIIGVPLKELPESFGMLSHLKTLKLEVPLKELPGSFGMLSCLQTLELKRCPILERLSSNFINLSSLRRLLIHDCPQLKGGMDLPKSLQEVHEPADYHRPPKFGTCPLLMELESFGWVQSMQYDGLGDLERIYKRPQIATL